MFWKSGDAALSRARPGSQVGEQEAPEGRMDFSLGLRGETMQVRHGKATVHLGVGDTVPGCRQVL